MPRVDPRFIVSLQNEVDELIRRLPMPATFEEVLLLVQTLRGLLKKVVIDQPAGRQGFTLELSFVPSAFGAPGSSSSVAGLESVTVRKFCSEPTTASTNLVEKDGYLREGFRPY